MDGEKETAEEKEEEEEEEEEELHGQTAVASSADSQNLPIMHWEDLSQRIAELEKQEQERRERTKRLAGRRMNEDEEDDGQRCRVVSSRCHNHRNLQLCFINNSDSEEEEGADKKVPMGTRHNGCHAAGLKQEVAAALRALRDELLAEQKEQEVKSPAGSSGAAAERKHLEAWQLQENALQQLVNTRASLQQEVHALSSELVAQLLVRDQLRTKQDAMLLDVQDLT